MFPAGRPAGAQEEPCRTLREPDDDVHRTAVPQPLRRGCGRGLRRASSSCSRTSSTKGARRPLTSNGLTHVLHNLPAGDWAGGERGIACHPDRDRGVSRRRRPGDRLCPALHARRSTAWQASCRRPSPPMRRARPLIGNLRYAAGKLHAAGIRLAAGAGEHLRHSRFLRLTARDRRWTIIASDRIRTTSSSNTISTTRR